MFRKLLLFVAVMATYALIAWASVAFGQEIVGPEEAGISQPVWLTLDLPEGFTGKFDAHLLDTDPTHVAPGAAMFFSLVGGSFRIVAAVVDEAGEIQFVEHTIVVKSDGPPSPDQITSANVAKWLAEVPAAVRNETITNPITGEEITRQQAVGETFLNIGKAGPALGAVGALDQMLSVALVSAMGENKDHWKPFGSAVDSGLANLKARDASVADYAAAFLVVGEVLTDE